MDDNRELQEQDDGDDRVLPTADTDPAPAPARRVTVPVAPSKPSSSRPRSNHAAAPGPPISHSTLDPASMDHEELGDFLDDEEDLDPDTIVALENNPEAFAFAMEFAASLAAGPEVGNIISTDAAPRAPATASAVPGPRISHSTLQAEINDFLDHYSSQPVAALDMEFDMDLDMFLPPNDPDALAFDEELHAPLLLGDTRVPPTTSLAPGQEDLEHDDRVDSTTAPARALGRSVPVHHSSSSSNRALDSSAARASLNAYLFALGPSTDITVENARIGEVTLRLPSPTLGLVKQHISALFHIPEQVQRVSIADNEIKDDEEVILLGSRLLLDTDVHVVVEANDTLHPIDVEVLDTVAILKELLEQKSNGKVPAASTTIMYRGAEMDDGKQLADYQLSSPAMFVNAVRKDRQLACDDVEDDEEFFCRAMANQPSDQASTEEQQRQQASTLPAAVSQPTTTDQHSTFAERAAAKARQQLIAVNVVVMPGGNAASLLVRPAGTVDDMRPMIASMAAQLQPPASYYFSHRDQRMTGGNDILGHGVKDGDTIHIIPNKID